MESPPETSHLTHCKATFNDCLAVCKAALAIFFPADVEMAEISEFDETDVIVFAQEKEFQCRHVRQHHCKYILRPTVNVSESGTETNVALTILPPVVWRPCIRPIHNMALKSALNNPVNVVREVVLFFQLSGLLVCVYVGVLD